MSSTAFKEYPEVVDERIDNKFWSLLKDSVNLFIRTKPLHERMHVWISDKNMYAEKSSLANDSDIGYVFSVKDPRESKDCVEEIKTTVPFLVKEADEAIFVAQDCPLDLDYPDLQDFVFGLFEPIELKPGVQLTVKTDKVKKA